MRFLLLFLLPHISFAFDYGPVGNNVFWGVLALWSFAISYALMQKRDVVWGAIANLAGALLSPGVRPHRLPRNPHIVVDDHRASVATQHHTQHASPAPHRAPEHKRPHIVGTATKPEFGPVALAHSTYAQKITKDSLKLEIVGGVPKLILTRDK